MSASKREAQTPNAQCALVLGLAGCQKVLTDTRIKVEEKGKKAVFVNDSKDVYLRTQVDGCLVKQSIAADWIVSKRNVGDIIVELKGCNIFHATEQVFATAQFWTERGLRTGKIAALVVGNQYPRVNTSIQRAKEKFLKQFGGPMHVVTKNYEYKFERVLDRKSPLAS